MPSKTNKISDLSNQLSPPPLYTKTKGAFWNDKYISKQMLKAHLDPEFEGATRKMIYCDYGALSASDRQIIMNKAYRYLKPGGKFLLDVFSIEKYHAFQETQTWEISHQGGFWREGEYLALNGCYKYPGCVTLEQTLIISDKEMTSYYLWNTCFTKEALIQEAREAGFKLCGIFGDVAGGSYREGNNTIAVLLEK